MTRALLGGLPLLAALLLPAVGWCDAAGSYRAALTAIDHENWARAVVELKRALVANPSETGEKIKLYGMRFERYLPYFYLGVALYRQGDCRGAVAAFRDSLTSRVVRGVQRSRLEIYDEICRERLGLTLAAVAALPPTTGGAAQPPAPSQGGIASLPLAPGTTPIALLPDPISEPPTSTQAARQAALDGFASEAARAIEQGEKKLERLLERQRAGAAEFRNDPNLAPQLEVLGKKLRSARFLLDASRTEGDLESAERARDEALAVGEVLDEVAQVVR